VRNHLATVAVEGRDRGIVDAPAWFGVGAWVSEDQTAIAPILMGTNLGSGKIPKQMSNHFYLARPANQRRINST
jgi:hypothetical protein